MRGLFLLPPPGSAGFGGGSRSPGYLHRDLVDEGGWFSDDEYQQASRSPKGCPGRASPGE